MKDTDLIADGHVVSDDLALGIAVFGNGNIILSARTGCSDTTIFATEDAARDFALEIIAAIREGKVKRAAAAAAAVEPEPVVEL